MIKEKETFQVRKRMKLGAGGQRTFLPGNREEVDQSHRRVLGITPEHEEIFRNNLISRYLGWGLLFVNQNKARYKVFFGADLNDWCLLFGQSGWISKSWSEIKGTEFDSFRKKKKKKVLFDSSKVEV